MKTEVLTRVVHKKFVDLDALKGLETIREAAYDAYLNACEMVRNAKNSPRQKTIEPWWEIRTDGVRLDVRKLPDGVWTPIEAAKLRKHTAKRLKDLLK